MARCFSSWRAIAAFICFFVSAPLFGGSSDAVAIQKRLVDIFEQNRSAIVRVIALSEDPSEAGTLNIGTGFLISGDAHVMTSASSVQGAEQVWVEHQHVAFEAELLGVDDVSNVAVLRLKQKPEAFTFIQVNDNQEKMPVSSMLFSISCEMGLDPSPALGLLTGYNLYYGDRVLPTTHIRTDIPSDGGEGGAPVFDLNGQLVGMMVASLPDIHSSFVLPTRAAKRILDDVMYSGRVAYSYIGMRIDERSVVTMGIPIRVGHVVAGSPAEKVGIQAGDIVTRVGSRLIRELPDLQNATFFSHPGRYLPIQIQRDGNFMDFSVLVEEHPGVFMRDETVVDKDAKDAGLTLTTQAPVPPHHQPSSDALH